MQKLKGLEQVWIILWDIGTMRSEKWIITQTVIYFIIKLRTALRVELKEEKKKKVHTLAQTTSHIIIKSVDNSAKCQFVCGTCLHQHCKPGL